MARVCAEPGCPLLAVDNRHCSEHKRQREARDRGWAQRQYDGKRESRHKRGYGSKWDKARLAFLSDHQRCEHCGAPSTDVDHIKPFRHNGKANWRLFWDRSNWQALCHSCHSRKTRAETKPPGEGSPDKEPLGDRTP